LKVTGDLKRQIFAALGDPESQQIMSFVIQEPKTSSTIADGLGLPPSTVYRKIGQMRECGLLLIDRFLISPDGKREALYACAFTEIRFKAEAQDLALEITLSQKALDRRWFEIFFSKTGESPDWQP
jgi:DNA-binding transcriptional ArsR family regulator